MTDTQQTCTSTTNEESACYDPTGQETCNEPAVWGQLNEETGATIWHCQTHADIVSSLRY